MHLFASNRYEWVLEADIEACFDNIDHTALLDRVRGRVTDELNGRPRQNLGWMTPSEILNQTVAMTA